jgi:hypothetical protein
MMKEVVVDYRIEVGSMVIEGLSYARLGKRTIVNRHVASSGWLCRCLPL